ncbi:MAG TPA: 2Fe-2S iron-sulfur cluster-binding protein [Myxococcaceae bacterium]|nr:2Fe-2S iron-sulfur cluster-binding protein [Myxococcaceae bacterium]
MRRLPPETAPELTIEYEGQPLSAREGEPAACALLAAGEAVFSRSIKYHRPRGPFCMAGSCSNCLVRIDGVPNRFACLTPVRAGMRIERQNAYPSVKVDVFGSIDWLFPKGMDHHSMFAGVPVAEKVMATVARHLAGLGLLPDSAPPLPRPAEQLSVDVAVVGAGAAGLAAIEVLVASGITPLVLEQEDRIGGRRVLDAPENGTSGAPPTIAGAQVRLGTSVLGLYDDELGRVLLAVQRDPEGARVLLIQARSILFAMGGHASMLPFENNDIPGVFSGRAAADLLRRRRLLVGDAPAVIGEGPQLGALARLFRAEGAAPRLVLHTGTGAPPEATVQGAPLRVHGRTWVHGLSYREAGGRERRVDCDAVVVSLPPTPAFELLRQAGVKISWRPELATFAPEVEADGRTAVAGIWAAGDGVRPGSAAEAAESGRRAAGGILGR